MVKYKRRKGTDTPPAKVLTGHVPSLEEQLAAEARELETRRQATAKRWARIGKPVEIMAAATFLLIVAYSGKDPDRLPWIPSAILLLLSLLAAYAVGRQAAVASNESRRWQEGIGLRSRLVTYLLAIVVSGYVVLRHFF